MRWLRPASSSPCSDSCIKRFQTPANAILLQTGLSVIVLLLGSFVRILAYIIFSALLFLAITVMTLFRMSPAPRGWWFPAAPVVFLICCAVIALLLLLQSPLPALLGVLIVLLGILLRPVFRGRVPSASLATSERRSWSSPGKYRRTAST